MKYTLISICIFTILFSDKVRAESQNKVKDEFLNESVCGWNIPEGHNTGMLSVTADDRMKAIFSGKDFCIIERIIQLDFDRYPELSIKIDQQPEGAVWNMKVEQLSDHNKYHGLYINDAKHIITADNKDIYIWNAGRLLDDKSIEKKQTFKLQVIITGITTAREMTIDWIRSEYDDDYIAPEDKDQTPGITAKYKKINHLIIYGQSLSEGMQSYPALSSDQIEGNYVIGKQVWIKRGNYYLNQLNPLIAGPSVQDINTNFSKNRESGAKCENPIVAAANHIQLKSGGDYPIIATSCGNEGRTIEELSKHCLQPKDKIYPDFIETLEAMTHIKNKFGIQVSCPAIFWMQGESNYLELPGLIPGQICTNDKDEYKKLMVQLKEDMQNDIKSNYSQIETPLFITYQTGAQYIKNKQQTISTAQVEASNQYDDIICAGPVYPMPDRGGHLDANGYRWYGEMLGKVYYQTVILKQNFKPLQPKRIVKNNDSQITIEFLVPVPPLEFDREIVPRVKNYGFSVVDKNGNKTISSISIQENSVIILCSTPFVGEIEISYAGMQFDGNGNLRDSDPYQSFYRYQDLDIKENDTYIYPREKNETTLRPWFDPVSLYGQPYPLYNFCVHFFYTIKENESEITVPYLENTSGDIQTVKKQKNLSLKRINENYIQITGNTDLSGSQFTIYNIYGQELLKGKQNPINISGLPYGIYILKADTDNCQKQIKFIR